MDERLQLVEGCMTDAVANLSVYALFPIAVNSIRNFSPQGRNNQANNTRQAKHDGFARTKGRSEVRSKERRALVP
ncbi:MAG: hypothetical protein OXB95_10830 [Rhodobacteraceae bacterium]|nr:hypothetical protein [Paracoccaceae bacterium]